MLPRSAAMLSLAKDNGQNLALAASMPPPLLMTEVKPAAAKRGAEGAGLRSVMRRETIGLPARPRLYLLRSDERLPLPGSGSFSRSEPHDCVRGGAPHRVQRSARSSPSAETSRSPSPPSRQGRQPALLIMRAGSGCYAIFSLLHSKQVPSVQMQCRTTAILRATATLAFLAPTRFISRTPHAFNADQRCVRCSKTLAASNK